MDLRAAKVAGVDVPDAVVDGDADADVVVIGWGSTWGAIDAAADRIRRNGGKVANVHLRHLNPLPGNLGDIVARYRHVLVPEMNSGQLLQLVRANYLVDAKGLNKVNGVPFTSAEIEAGILGVLAGS